jgi:hypothetical protein
MLGVAVVLLVLDNDKYRCCQSENCSDTYTVRVVAVRRWANGLQTHGELS